MPSETAASGTKGLGIRLSKNNWGFKGKNYLFLIAIDHYLHWTKLKCAKGDVEKFKTILTTKYQFEEQDVTYLSDSRASLRNILTEFRKLANKITKDDNLIIYFSGHGHYIPEIETGYWIPQNAHCNEECEDEFINTIIILDKIRTIKSLHTFLIVDACFSGALLANKKGSITRTEQHRSRRVFTSGRHDELVNDGPAGGHSPFAEILLKVLIENRNRYISASRLIVEIRENLKGDQSPQDGRINDDDGGDFVFHVKLDEDELWGSVLRLNTIEAYEKFAKQFPDSPHKPEALDASAWLVAFEKHTINSLNHYLSKYLDGKFAPRAAEALDELYWQRAKSHHTPLGYRKYLVTCPNGKYYEQAKAEAGKFVDTLDEESIEEALSEESKIHPPVPPADDEKAWIETKALNTFIAYQNFTKAYNHSKHLTEANRLMNHLDKVNSNLINIEFMSVNNLTDTKSNRPKKEKIKLLEDLINKCKAYYIKFPAAPNNRQVAEIRNKLQIRLLGLIK